MEALEIKTGVILCFIRVNVVAAIHYLSHQKMLLPTSVPFVGGKMMYDEASDENRGISLNQARSNYKKCGLFSPDFNPPEWSKQK